MTFWQLFDAVAVGWYPVSIDGSFPTEDTKRRISALTQPPVADSTVPLLTTLVDGDRVEASYEAVPDGNPGAGPGYLLVIRPVFRGRLIAGDPVRLVGQFGASPPIRYFGLGAVVVLVLMIADSFKPTIWDVGHWLWAAPLLFIAACVVSRINGADDIPFILKNLWYAMRGDG